MKFITLLITLSITLFSAHPFLQANELTVDDFLAPPDMLTAKMSPDGKHIATVWNNGDERAVIVFDIKESKVIARFGDRVIRPYSVSWANNKRLLVKLLVPFNTSKVRKDAESKEDFDINDYYMFGRMVSTQLDGQDMVELMNDERTVKRNRNLANVIHYLPDEPDHILMAAYSRERLTLYKVNVTNGDSERVVIGGRFTYSYSRDTKRNLLFRYDFKRIAKTIEILSYNKTEDDWELVDTIYFDDEDTDKNKVEMTDLAGIKDGKLVYRKLNEETGYHELITVEDGKREVLVSLPNKDIVSVITSGFDNEVIGYTTLSDIYRSQYFSENRQAIYDKAAASFKGENFNFSSIADNNTYAIIKSWGSVNPVTYFTYDMKNDSMSTLNYPYSSLPSKKLASGFKVQYVTRDKKAINAYLYAPAEFDGSKALPLVVMPHGGPQSRDTLNYSDFTQFIATRGYLVIKPNFRGSSGYGKAFQESGYREWGAKMQEDLEDAVAFLVKEQLADPSKVCIVGASYGGYAALMGVVKTPELYKCAISVNGVTHLPEQVEYDLDKYDSEILQKFIKDSIGHPINDANMLKARSPALHADKIKADVLLIHGNKDEIVPYEQFEFMVEAFEDINKKVESITLEDTGHNALYYEEDIRIIYEAVERVLAKNLK
ncbi:alpha/beta hydrolase family protein [Glaciecola petra]|uniref:S9 family peptidase n=1 Tax=Glaciecola petra TaxID=3075602 RepID=A0ABU2ZSK9_9ALTE|nr:S9 family peptidase [Aestuariibacter sp. P117]MDT0595299.1 S9 family peptidase [Aestuariibacter sp. P117]